MRVRFFAYIRNFTKCAETDIPYEEISAGQVTTGSDSENRSSPQVTIGALARYLCDLYGDALRQKIFPSGSSGGAGTPKRNKTTGEKQFVPEIIILINGRHVGHLGGISAPLNPDDRVDIFPVVAGG